MTEVYAVTFAPTVGEVVEIPEKVGRITSGNYHGGASGNANFRISVIGQGELVEHVVLKLNGDEHDIEEGSQVLTVDLSNGSLFYAVPREAYQ